ncbi:MAG TPA: hypothetical protein VD928_01795 [Candidatus Paceibacterota bacterium]|nr:hypothetical protein [Candidatus Paceibacterota bacterium]
MKAAFSIEESLRFGWKKTKAHSALVFQSVLTIFGLQVLHAIVANTLEETFVGVLALCLVIIAEIFVGVGITLISLRIAREESVSYRDILPPLKVVWNYLVASTLSGLLVLLGLFLFIIPGVYFAMRYSMVRFAVLDLSNKPGAILGSLKKSSEITNGVKWQILLFTVVIIVINILGAVLFLVGLLITVPVTMIAYAHVYDKLLNRV